MKHFWKGFFSIFDISGVNTKINIKKTKPKTDEEAWQEDGEAIRKDWENVGNYLRNAMNEVNKKIRIRK